jgi:hypothetical protein
LDWASRRRPVAVPWGAVARIVTLFVTAWLVTTVATLTVRTRLAIAAAISAGRGVILHGYSHHLL